MIADNSISQMWISSPLREKCPNTEVYLVPIFPGLFSLFSQNVEKYWPEKTPYPETFHNLLSCLLTAIWIIPAAPRIILHSFRKCEVTDDTHIRPYTHSGSFAGYDVIMVINIHEIHQIQDFEIFFSLVLVIFRGFR